MNSYDLERLISFVTFWGKMMKQKMNDVIYCMNGKTVIFSDTLIHFIRIQSVHYRNGWSNHDPADAPDSSVLFVLGKKLKMHRTWLLSGANCPVSMQILELFFKLSSNGNRLFTAPDNFLYFRYCLVHFLEKINFAPDSRVN